MEALLDRTFQWGPQLGRNRLPEEVAEPALAYRRAAEGGADAAAGRRLDLALGRLHESPSPRRGWLAPEAMRLVREALRGVLDGLARKPPVVGALAARRTGRPLVAVWRPGRLTPRGAGTGLRRGAVPTSAPAAAPRRGR